MRLAILLSILFAATAEATWFKGNTHTHTSESDGDSSPADVARWYADHGYDFLVLTDHDKVTRTDGGAILLIPGEEITDRLVKTPLHVCALGIDKAILPQGGGSVAAILQHDIDAVHAAGGLAVINHPNFGWAFGSVDLLKVERLTLLEIASGHPFVNVQGPPSVEQMWDALLTAGRRVWGVAVDDSHHLKRPWDTDMAPPGKAWIVVRAQQRDARSILSAIEGGDFYSSTGVELTDYTVTSKVMTVSIREKNQARYRTQFIGPKGLLLHESRENPASFILPRNAGYVRARVLDSNGRTAWLQPHFLKVR